MTTADAYKKEMELFEEREKEAAKYFEDQKKEREQAAKESEKLASDKLKAERDLYKDLRKYSGEYFGATLRLIEEQAKKYRELGIDAAAIAAWVKEETIKAYIEMAQKSNDWITGFRAGLLDIQRDMMTWGKAAFDMVKTFSSSASSTLSSVFFDAAKGQLKDFSDYWTAFTDAMLKKFVDILAQMIVEWTLMQMTLQRSSASMSAFNSAVSAAGISQAAASSATIGQLIPVAGGGYLMASGNAMAPVVMGANGAPLQFSSPAAAQEFLGANGATFEAASYSAGAYLGAAGLGYLGGSMLGGALFGEDKSTWTGIGGALGAAGGLYFGGPVGAVIGGAIGTVIGGIAEDVGNFVGDVISDIGDFFGFAKGGVFSSGNLVPFAAGGAVYSTPTYFPMTGGRMGVFAESEPEAIMPLERGRDGQLGVRAFGGGSNLETILYQIAKNTAKTAKILSRFDDDGLPAERVLV